MLAHAVPQRVGVGARHSTWHAYETPVSPARALDAHAAVHPHLNVTGSHVNPLSQRVPHAPQLSVVFSATHTPLHRVCPAGHAVHRPDTHASAPMQVAPASML